ncbi:LysR family transcriptional regulator [Photobacterium sp. BZF1]|uniref:LysR family transcriptional regulator n=1 Tax=Photobacterium sp. BZF1 TaxID=1904457 RepID=UPI001653E007|nr:LysR family transcriptional regulator [Photobacterium sp. BZF1]MBC7004864.1 LysR family transcriptional regulator [Photobacterium sp. BZF1]
MKEIRDLDLNLLKLLQAVVETQNTHAAADKLGISQTSVSRGLAKLRETFGDQLFIRKAHGVQPSELAEKLAEAADEMFNPLIKVVDSYRDFNPQTFNGEVTIALNIFLLEICGEGIFTALREALPKAKFKLKYWQEGSLAEMLNGHIDYMVHFSAFPLPQDIYQHRIKEIKLCLVARKNHPILKDGSEWERIHQLPIAKGIVDGINSKRTPVEELYLSKGYKANIDLVSHSARVIFSKLKHTDAILYGSSFMLELDPTLSTYPLPTVPKEIRQLQVIGGYLQSKRGFPLNQILHQTMQTYFDDLIQPE